MSKDGNELDRCGFSVMSTLKINQKGGARNFLIFPSSHFTFLLNRHAVARKKLLFHLIKICNFVYYFFKIIAAREVKLNFLLTIANPDRSAEVLLEAFSLALLS